MDELKEFLLNISIESDKINIEDIQGARMIMEQLSKIFACNNAEYIKYSHELLDNLWHRMQTGFVEFEDQLICSTCFFAILFISDEQEKYLRKVLKLINYELDLKEKGVEVSESMFNTISLAYGIFHSSILKQNSDESTLAAILENIFTLLSIMAYEYSQYTFITFKIMTVYKKAVGTIFEKVIFNEKHNFKVLNIINHNWENPITGVRSLNKIIFHNLIENIDDSTYSLIEQKLNSFYWNKAKYLMLTEIVECWQGNIVILLNKYDIVEGLVHSLKKAGLVSAGTDLYVSVLKKLNTEEQWCEILLPSIINAIKDSSIIPIENFNNYWCLNTLKTFPSLLETICDKFKNLDSYNHRLYSYLYIIQQSSRLGILEKYFNNSIRLNDVVSNNMYHEDIHIRMVSFNIICGYYTKYLPNQDQYELILNFLKNNVNSDNCKLRIEMMKALKNFLVQLHITFVKYSQNNKKSDIDNLTTFCKELQIFVIESLELNGNYQRKIVTIQITKAILEFFKEIPRKKQNSLRHPQTSLLHFIRSRNQWILGEDQFILKLISLLKDPSEDIREHAMHVLRNNYSQQLCNSQMIQYLTEEALSCIRSRFFYQITCGETIFKLIYYILLMEGCAESKFKKVEDIFDFAYLEIKSECNSNLDIVRSIVEGKQLHAYLNILHSVFEISLENSYELKISTSVVDSLIKLLEDISNQFAWEQETSGSSDFSKMNDMIQTMISCSEYEMCTQFNDTNMSGLHQIVLNCLWLNVKASCDLSSVLIRYYKNYIQKDICEKCLEIICNVLETSRHKGAIEAAGSSLGQGIQQLTSMPASFEMSQIPMFLLKKKIKQLVLETSNMASVTRRGAGLSIMIHRIVSNDMKKRKPLFQYFMKTLLETCNKMQIACEVETNNEKDLPQAVYIHFLTKVVADSSLASDMMYYSNKLAKLAFDNLSSPCWQIRNAALQLYGSLIPKLIGQKKNSGSSEEVIASIAVDEFRTHSPKLWEYIEMQLMITIKSCSDVVQCHNNLLPILNILANLAPYYSFTNEMESKKNLLPNFISLLGSPIYVVRRLASKGILNIYPFEVVLDVLLNCTCETENSLHGALILLSAFNKQYTISGPNEKGEILKNRYSLLVARKCSYLSKEQFENTFPETINLTEKMLTETLTEMCEKYYAPGIFLWANFRIGLFLEGAAWDTMPQIIILISDCCNFETYCEILCKRIQREKSMKEEILLQLSNSLYLLGFKRKSSIIWKTLYEISIYTHSLNKHIDTSLLRCYLLNNKVSYRLRYMIAFAARVFTKDESEMILILSNIIFNLSYPDTEVDMRLIGTIANNELADKLNNLSDKIKINAIKSAIMFLQDEDEDVRNMSVHFYRKVNVDETNTHPYIAWRNMLNTKFLHKILGDPCVGIKSLYNDLLNLLESLNNIDNKDEYNPFANDLKNVYFEPEVLKKELYGLKFQ